MKPVSLLNESVCVTHVLMFYQSKTHFKIPQSPQQALEPYNMKKYSKRPEV